MIPLKVRLLSFILAVLICFTLLDFIMPKIAKAGDLSEHFSTHEFACKDNCGEGGVHPKLIERLEALRADLGNKPLYITSGYRCAKHNKKVGGVKNSQHRLGLAVDFHITGMSMQDLSERARLIGFNYVEFGKGYVHADMRGIE